MQAEIPSAKEPQKKIQTKRMLWIAPNFAAVSSNTELPPLSARGKFNLAFHDSFDSARSRGRQSKPPRVWG
jgi:hypothetical protein